MKAVILALLGCSFVAGAASAEQPAAYFVDQSKLPFAELVGLPSQRTWGVLDGAGYRIEIPASWNGSLVLWAHGFRGRGLELTVDNHPLRPLLLAQGYAWAASSYSKNDYDPGQGAKDTHALRQYFANTFGNPNRTYITGASMGGHVTAIVAEQWHGSYDGAMPVCGVLGDYELFDYFLDFNVSAQTLSGTGQQFPYAADYLAATVPATKAALGPAFPFALNAAGQNFKALMQLRSGGVRHLFDQGFLFWTGVVPGDFLFGLGLGDGTLLRHPGVVVQNSDVTYQFDTNPALSAAETLFNDTVQRITADRQARSGNGLAGVPRTSGDLRIPMLTLHTLGDLFVPFHMEQIYAARVAANGAAHLLVQRATRDFGHCSFTGPELGSAFVDLVRWVEGGVKPLGDDVLDAAAVAGPHFGCRFTDKASPRSWDNPALGFLKPAACPAQ